MPTDNEWDRIGDFGYWVCQNCHYGVNSLALEWRKVDGEPEHFNIDKMKYCGPVRKVEWKKGVKNA
jgi:hypothetical protein